MLRVDINLLFEIINIIILFIAFKIFLFKPVKEIIAKRQEEADAVLQEAQKVKEEADAKKKEYEDTLVSFEDEKHNVMSEARKSANEEYLKIVKDAKDIAKKIQIQADNEAEKQKAKILKKAETEIADMVVEAATKMVAEKSNDDSNRALYDEFINKAGDHQ